MQIAEGHFQGKAGYQLYYRYWLPETEARAVVLLAHGIAEHCGRYERLAGFLASRGLAVYALDHRYHGRSQGKHGHLDNFAYFREDFRTFHLMTAGFQPARKVYLFGHSMGAAISLDYAAAYPDALSGLIISGAPLAIQPPIPAAVVALLLPLARAAPGLGLYSLDSSTLSHDPAVVRAYNTDPLVYRGKLTVRLTVEFLWSLHRLKARVDRVSLPLLILHGEKDNLCLPEGSRLAYNKAASPDKTLKIYPGLYHEILNEPEHDLVLKDIDAWLNQHINGSPVKL